jgi:iron-sulfur cluster repair protein YtfE (RIC family)
MSLQTTHSGDQLDNQLNHWLTEHRELDLELTRFLKRLTSVHWPTEIQLLGIRSMLDRLVEHLDAHFTREGELVELLVAARQGQSTPEIEAVHRQTMRDRHAILARVGAVRERLCDPLRARQTWAEIKAELNLIADVLEQHEEQERESIAWLRPREGSE